MVNKMNQRERVLKYIKDFGSISNVEGIHELGISDIRKRISELRRDGIEIIGTRVEAVNRYGEPTHYNKYTLAKDK